MENEKELSCVIEWVKKITSKVEEIQESLNKFFKVDGREGKIAFIYNQNHHVKNKQPKNYTANGCH